MEAYVHQHLAAQILGLPGVFICGCDIGVLFKQV